MSPRRSPGASGLALLLACALSSPSWGAEKLKIAVLPLNAGPGVDPKVASLITESLVSELNNRLGIKVISAQEIQATLGFERQRQLLGCSEGSSCLAEIGGALGVDKIVIGTLGKLGGSLIFNLQLVDMHTSVAEKRFSKRIRNTSEEGFLDAVGEAVDALFAGAGPPPPREPPTASEKPPSPPPAASPQPPPQAVAVSESPMGEERRLSLSFHGQFSPLQVGGVSQPGGALSLLLGFQPTPDFSFGVGAMTSAASTGGVARAAWIPWNAGGSLHPVVALEVPVLVLHGPPPAPPGTPQAGPPASTLTVGVSLNPGLELQPLPWLTAGLELPLTFLPVTPDPRIARFWIFGALTVGIRF